MTSPVETRLAADMHAFSYCDRNAPWWRRSTARLVELLTGQPYFVNMYLGWRAEPRAGESFFAAALRLLDIDLRYDETMLAAWPQHGPLLVVCNHPFGVIDALSACHLAHTRRGDFRVLANAVLNCVDEIKPFVLPVDFDDTPDALATNLRSRDAALAHIRAGGCVVVFPAGGISTTPSLFETTAEDAPWKTFVARLVREGRASVAPIHFPGQNSLLFQIASHVCMDLRLALMFRETQRMMHRRIDARLGQVLTFERLVRFERSDLTRQLRNAVDALGRGFRYG